MRRALLMIAVAAGCGGDRVVVDGERYPIEARVRSGTMPLGFDLMGPEVAGVVNLYLPSDMPLEGDIPLDRLDLVEAWFEVDQEEYTGLFEAAEGSVAFRPDHGLNLRVELDLQGLMEGVPFEVHARGGYDTCIPCDLAR